MVSVEGTLDVPFPSSSSSCALSLLLFPAPVSALPSSSCTLSLLLFPAPFSAPSSASSCVGPGGCGTPGAAGGRDGDGSTWTGTGGGGGRGCRSAQQRCEAPSLRDCAGVRLRMRRGYRPTRDRASRRALTAGAGPLRSGGSDPTPLGTEPLAGKPRAGPLAAGAVAHGSGRARATVLRERRLHVATNQCSVPIWIRRLWGGQAHLGLESLPLDASSLLGRTTTI